MKALKSPEILQIQSLISSVQTENAELLEKNTMVMKDNLELQSINFELKRKISEFEDTGSFSVGVSHR